MSHYIKPWDGSNPPDYVPHVKPGDKVRIERGDTQIVSRVVRTEGYGPDVVEFEHNVRVDIGGWMLVSREQSA